MDPVELFCVNKDYALAAMLIENGFYDAEPQQNTINDNRKPSQTELSDDELRIFRQNRGNGEHLMFKIARSRNKFKSKFELQKESNKKIRTALVTMIRRQMVEGKLSK